MSKNVLFTDSCIDAIVIYNDDIILGGYDYNDNNERNGKICFVNKKTFEIFKVIKTTGTFHLKVYNELLYVLNSNNLTIIKNKEIEKQIMFDRIILYVEVCEKFIYISDIKGKIIVLNKYNYEEEYNIQCQEPIWILKWFNNKLYFGDESGNLFYARNKEHNVFYKFDAGVINIITVDNLLYVTSYDGTVKIFENDKCINSYEKIGSIWRMEQYREYFICATMYDGLKIYDLKFNLIYKQKTDSLCYGLCIYKNYVFYSSFYSKTVNILDLNEILQ